MRHRLRPIRHLYVDCVFFKSNAQQQWTEFVKLRLFAVKSVRVVGYPLRTAPVATATAAARPPITAPRMSTKPNFRNFTPACWTTHTVAIVIYDAVALVDDPRRPAGGQMVSVFFILSFYLKLSFPICASNIECDYFFFTTIQQLIQNHHKLAFKILRIR